MTDALQFLISGLTIGSIYAIVALGFVTVYSVTKVINLAQGEFVMLGGMIMFTLVSSGMNYWLAFACTVISVMVIGWLMERVVMRSAKTTDPISLIILTIGLAIFIKGIASLIWGKDSVKIAPFTKDEPIRIMGAAITPQSIWVMVFMVAIVLVLYFLIERTMLGKAFQASSVNLTAARLMGISPYRMSSLAFALSGGLGALAGLVISPILFPAYDMGLMLSIKGFSACILGGLGSAPGAVLGGLLLGILESLGAGYISSGLKDAIAFGIVLILLLFRPYGLLGEKNIGKGSL